MKTPLLALLCFETVAFCQSPAPQKIDPDKLFQMPEKFTDQARDFGKLTPQPFKWNNHLVLPPPETVVPRRKLNNPQIDPKIILHPPWRNHRKGQDVSHLFPNLKLLPLR